jgi:hypothetical protein
MAKRFAVYKGLQRPLIYKGFKGKYIYWGIASLLLGLIVGALVMSIINMYAGVLVLAAIIAGGLLYTAGKQKGGLNSKPRARKVLVHPASLKIRKLYGKKEGV